jgi:hypothetical protein
VIGRILFRALPHDMQANAGPPLPSAGHPAPGLKNLAVTLLFVIFALVAAQ